MKNIFILTCFAATLMVGFASNSGRVFAEDNEQKQHLSNQKNIAMKHEKPNLPYGPDALEPHMSKETIEFHYGKHHQAYVDNLNKLIPGTGYENKTLEEIIKTAEGPIFNNAAQVWNHSFFFLSLSPSPQKMPQGKLAEAIQRDFDSFDKFKEEFSAAAASVFGSGWAWLVSDGTGKLSIVKESNAGNPMRNGLNPVMTCDVWEHAYYIDYRNRRPEFIQNFWEILDWRVIEQRYK